MLDDWKIYKLKACVEVNPKEKLSKGRVSKKIGMDRLEPFCRDVAGYEMAKFSGGSKFRNGDTIMARITPCLENGKIAMVNILDSGEVGFGSTEYIVFRAKSNVTDPDYVYYLICSPYVRDIAIKSMVGSSGRQRVQTDIIRNLELPFPDIEIQKNIASILKVLDDKICLNNKINKNLEQQMEAIYKSWFIDFKPFGGTKPSSWQNGDIYSIANIIYGAPFASKMFNTDGIGKPIIRIRDLKNQEFSGLKVDVGDIKFARHKFR